MNIKYDYKRTGTERKALVDAISQILEKPAVYLGAPTFAYAVGDYGVSKKGSLFSLNSVSQEEMEHLVFCLQEKGFIAESVSDEIEVAGTENAGTAAVEDPGSDRNTLTVEIPKTGFTDAALDNLYKIIASKETLFKKALGAERLLIADTGDTLKFPWFTLHGLEGEADAYSMLVAAICSMAKKQKRVTAKESVAGNDRFNMRLFLVRLGFVGEEYKAARKLLLRNLTGNSSWKSGHAPECPGADTGATEADAAKEGGAGSDGK